MGMKRKILSLLLCFVMLLSLVPTMAFAAEAETYDVYVNGEQFTSDKLTINGDSGTATYDPTAGTVTLDGYIGGAIRAEKGDLIINVIGMNKVTVIGSDIDYGIRAVEGDLIISGDGDLEVDLSSESSHSAIFSRGALTVNMAGDLTVKSQYTALYGYAGLTISGSGNVTVIKKETTRAYGVGVLAHENNVTISGSGMVTIDADSSAVGLGDPKGELKLEGTGSIISLTAGDGCKAVDNFMKGTSPVGGSALSNYAVTGAPDTQSIVYKLAYPVYVNGEQFTGDKLTIKGSSGTATYNLDTNTLTLDNAKIDQTYLGYGIYAENALNIVLKGSNSTTNLYSIRVKGDLTVSGEGSLSVKGTGQGNESTIYADGGKVVFDCAGDITIDSKTTCVSATNDVTLAGSGNITMESSRSGSMAVESVSGDVIISGSGEIGLKGNAHAVGADLKLNGEATPITLSTIYTGTAVYGTVAGTAIDNYNVTGDPATTSVTYELKTP